MKADPKTSQNQILVALSVADTALLAPHLEPVDLPVRKLLEGRGRKIEHVYFLDRGLASVVVTGGSNHALEVGIVGREGVTGMAVILGTDRSVHETFIQSAGSGRRIAVNPLRQAIEASPTLRKALLRYCYVLMVQMTYTALANGRYKIEERLARWLLMAHDRVDGSQIDLTHEFLSVMLGVRRPGVTAAINELKKRGMIEVQRGAVIILDRESLEDAANGSYGAPEAEYQRVFGGV